VGPAVTLLIFSAVILLMLAIVWPLPHNSRARDVMNCGHEADPRALVCLNCLNCERQDARIDAIESQRKLSKAEQLIAELRAALVVAREFGDRTTREQEAQIDALLEKTKP
jgi:hypothetical protein